MNTRNNPLNIKWANPDNPAALWKGSSGYDDRGHAIFADPAMGIRAAMRSLQSKWLNGKRTIRAIIADWAPSDDTVGSLAGTAPNDPDSYAGFVAGHSGLLVDDPLPNPAANSLPWTAIIHAMARYELGEDCPDAVIYRGIRAWHDDFIGKAKA
jgi:hypothetical protein